MEKTFSLKHKFKNKIAKIPSDATGKNDQYFCPQMAQIHSKS